MAKLAIKKASTDVTVYLFIQDSSVTTGAGKTGLAYNTSSLVAYYVRPLGSATQLTLATQTVTGAHSDGGFVEVDATNMPGLYRLDLSDAICATGVNSVVVMLKGAANMAPVVLEIQLTSYDPNDAVRLGMTALPNAAADAAGGLPISDAGALDLDALNTNVSSILADTGTDGVLLSSGTGAKQISLSSGAVLLQATQTGVTIPTVTSITNGVTLADDAITSAKFDESTAFPLKSADTGSTAVARVGADSDTLETLSDQIDGVSPAAIADGIWDELLPGHAIPGSAGDALANIDVSGVADAVLDELMAGHAIAGSLGKLLTDLPDDVYDLLAAIPAVSLAVPTPGDTLELYAGDSIEFNVTGLGDLTDVDEIYFTMKKDLDDADSAAIWQVSLTGGLLYLNGAAAATPGNSSITVVDLAGGEIQVKLKAVESIEIPCRNYQYDVKTMTDPDTALSKTQGDVEFKPVVTKAIT